jgi:hypothetical protein
VIVFNWARSPNVGLELGRQLKAGESYRLMNPRDLFGEPVAAGVYDGNPVAVPVKGEFAAFVLVRDGRAATPASFSAIRADHNRQSVEPTRGGPRDRGG